MIASKEEIKSLAFSRNFDINSIKDNVIELIELEQIKELLGDTLYSEVKSTPSSYCELLELLKPTIAYYLKYYILKNNHVKTGNKGTQIATGGNESQGDVEMAKREALTFATKYRKQVLIYIKENNLEITHKDDDSLNGIIII